MIVSLAIAQAPLGGQAAREVHVAEVESADPTVAGFLKMNHTKNRILQALPTGDQEMAIASNSQILT